MASIIAAIKMGPTLSYYFSSSETLLRNPPPTLYPCPNYIMKLSSQVTTELTQQFIEALKSVNTKQEPPPPIKPVSAGYKDKPEEPKGRASILEFKKVNEVYVYTRVQPDLARANTIQLG
jgi:hypothetical protein